MSCCGNKRAQLRRGQPTQALHDDLQVLEEPGVRERKARTFEYIGSAALTVRGAVSGKTYRFAFSGERIEVAYDDSSAMLAERHVKPVSSASANSDTATRRHG